MEGTLHSGKRSFSEMRCCCPEVRAVQPQKQMMLNAWNLTDFQRELATWLLY